MNVHEKLTELDAKMQKSHQSLPDYADIADQMLDICDALYMASGEKEIRGRIDVVRDDIQKKTNHLSASGILNTDQRVREFLSNNMTRLKKITDVLFPADEKPAPRGSVEEKPGPRTGFKL